MAKLSTVEGIGPSYAKQLEGIGISSTNQLLTKGADKKGRKEIADKTGLSPKLVLTWVNHVDMQRVKGVGGEYSELLEAAGVDSVPELAQRNAENLHAKMTEVNATKKLVRRVPTLKEVTDWVAQAKGLPRVVTY